MSLRESGALSGRVSKGSLERPFEKGTIVPITKFGRAIEALWPDKPALNLAQRMGVNPATGKPFSERNALQLIRGERRVTARAMHVLNAEVLD